jgi:integral membrane protein
MPLKYYGDMPAFVKYGGWAHGILFVAYVALLLAAALKYDWKISKAGWVFVASLIPFAPFFVERKLKKDVPQRVTAN